MYFPLCECNWDRPPQCTPGTHLLLLTNGVSVLWRPSEFIVCARIVGRGLRFIVLIPEEQKAHRFHLFSILPSHVLFLDSLKPLWHLQIGIWGRSGSARHEAFPPHNNRVALEHGTASTKKKRKLYGLITSYLALYSLAQLLHSGGCVYCAHLPKNWSTLPLPPLD